MKWLYLSNAVTLAVSVLAIVISLSVGAPKPAPPAPPRPPPSVVPEANVMTEVVDELVRARVREELVRLDTRKLLKAKDLRKLLDKPGVMPARTEDQNETITFKGDETLTEKVQMLLKPFDNANIYHSENALVKQLVALGPDAVEPLLAELPRRKTLATWAKWRAIDDALNRILTMNDKDRIVELFADRGLCAMLVRRYAFPEAEDALLKALDTGHCQIDPDIINAAWAVCPDKARAKLLRFASRVKPGDAYPALAVMGGSNDPEVVTLAVTKAEAAERDYDKANYVDLLLSCGRPEAFPIAVALFDKSDQRSAYTRRELLEKLRMYTNAPANSDKEAKEWLEANRDRLRWNPETRRFE